MQHSVIRTIFHHFVYTFGLLWTASDLSLMKSLLRKITPPLLLGLLIVFSQRETRKGDGETKTVKEIVASRPAPPSGSAPGASTRITPAEATPDRTLPPLDHNYLISKARKLEKEGRFLFAEARTVNVAPHLAGKWSLSGDRAIWRYHLRSIGATSLNLAFSRFHLPPDSTLTISDPTGTARSVSFTSRDNDDHGELWTPLFETEELIVSLDVRPGLTGDLQLELAQVNHGFRTKGKNKGEKDIGGSRSGSCNIDVVCSAADNATFGPLVDLYRDQIRSVAAYTLNGVETCTGALVNNTRNDLTPYFLTANHCGISSSNAPSIVVYWNFENSTCRTPNTSASGNDGNGIISQFNSGSIYRASRSNSDFCLIELDDPVDPAFQPFYAGWDRSGDNPSQSVAIHHPGVSEKRISFELDPTITTNYSSNSSNPNGTHVRVIDWDFGTTEGGSSGSPLFDEAGRIIGQLHGGGAACGNNLSDWYGRVSRSWQDGSSASRQLAAWLDPDNTGVVRFDGIDSDQVISIGDATVTEGNSGATSVNVTLTLSEATNETVRVRVRTQSGTATTSDYSAINQIITFSPGQTSRSVPVSIIGDTTPEENESFLLALSDPINATINSTPGQVTILNDDFIAPVITSPLTATVAANTPLEYQITALNTPTAFGIQNAPNGMSVDPVTGLISWTPSTTGSETVTILAGNSAGSTSRTLTLTVVPNSLATAIELPAFVGLSNGNPGWSRQTAVTFDGEDAGQADNIGDNQSAGFSIQVTGPDTLQYRYRVSSEQSYDFLTVRLDGSQRLSVSGNVNWQTDTIEIPSGNHTVSFVYSKDGSVSSGQDTAWIDTVSLESANGSPAITSPNRLIVDAGGPITYVIDSVVDDANFAVIGLPAGLTFDGEDTITGSLETPGDYTFEVVAGSNGQIVRMDVTVEVTASLGGALEQPELPWSRQGNANWFGQTEVTFDGVDAAESGNIGNNQSTSLSLAVTGPDFLSFQWRVSSEAGYDFLQFLMDGAVAPGVRPISGSQDWSLVTFAIPEGNHILTWNYQKDESASEGEDAGWLDDVRFASGDRPMVIARDVNYLIRGREGRFPLEFINSSSITFNNLPAWLSYDVQTNELIGTPPSSGQFDFNAIANGTGESEIRTVGVVVASASSLMADTLGNPGLPVITSGSPGWTPEPGASPPATRSGDIDHNESSTLVVFVQGPGTLRFEWSVNSEADYDFLHYSLNGDRQAAISGSVDWELIEIPLTAGLNQVVWTYEKDGADSEGDDLGRVRNIVLGGYADFLTEGEINHLDTSPGDDPDDNGLSLLHEYAFLVPPGNRDPLPALSMIIPENDSLPAVLQFDGRPPTEGVEYIMESNPTLNPTDWVAISGNLLTVPLGDNTRYRLVTPIPRNGQNRLYFRVRARFRSSD